MIAEAAFFKLPDYFRYVKRPEELYESQLALQFAMAIIQELRERGVPYPSSYVQVERPYPNTKNKADVFFKLPEEVLERLGKYGACSENWVEVKFFGGISRRRPESETKTDNVGKILVDLFRLKLYANGGRYLLIVFEGRPEQYIAFNKRKGKERGYLRKMFETCESTLTIDLREETRLVRNYMKKLKEAGMNEVNEVHLLRLTIKPLEIQTGASDRESEALYHFYLLRLLPPCI